MRGLRPLCLIRGRKQLKIVVLGAGAWGTAVAMSAAQHPAATRSRCGHATRRRPAPCRRSKKTCTTCRHGLAARLQAQRRPGDRVPRRRPGHRGHPHGCAARHADGTARPKHARGPGCKGFESPTGAQAADAGLLAHEVCAQVADSLRSGVLSGPSFAQEVACNQPTALVAASEHASVRETWSPPSTAPACAYANEDIVGVEVGGAVKNVLAIATGLCDGLALGLNARAAPDHPRFGRDDRLAWPWARGLIRSWVCRAWATWC